MGYPSLNIEYHRNFEPEMTKLLHAVDDDKPVTACVERGHIRIYLSKFGYVRTVLCFAPLTFSSSYQKKHSRLLQV